MLVSGRVMHLCPFPDSNHRQSRRILPRWQTGQLWEKGAAGCHEWMDRPSTYLSWKLTWHPKPLGFGRWIPFLGPRPTWQVLCFFGSAKKTYEIIVVLTGIDRVGSIPKHGWIFDWSARLGPCGIQWKPKTFLAALPFKCENTLFLMHYIHTYCAALSNCFFNLFMHIYIFYRQAYIFGLTWTWTYFWYIYIYI